MILSDKDSKRLQSRLIDKSDFEVQLELAKVTGGFKHGNERMGKKRR